MLILARRENERIVIDGNIEVHVTDIRRGVVKLGVEAPRKIPVNRGEVQDAIARRIAEAKKVLLTDAEGKP